jgi:hypothetical protein
MNKLSGTVACKIISVNEHTYVDTSNNEKSMFFWEEKLSGIV